MRVLKVSEMASLPVIDLCDSQFASSLPQTDASGRGVGQYMTTNWFLGICLESASTQHVNNNLPFCHYSLSVKCRLCNRPVVRTAE